MIKPIRHSNMKQTFHQITKRSFLMIKHGLYTVGVGLKTRYILAGEIKHPRRACLILGGDVKYRTKCPHFIAGHQAVCLGHFCPKGHHGDGEGDAALRRGPQTIKNR